MEVINYQETQIIEKSKKDPGAFEAVYNHYVEDIFQFVNKRLMDEEDAFDITQQVFFNALINLKKYKYRGFPFSSFLFKIAINECNQHFRNLNKVRYVTVTEESIPYLSEDILPDYQKETSIMQLSKVLQKLKHEELFLIELRYFEHRSFKEVAQILEISENNCKVKVHRIIKKLKKTFIRDEK